MDTEDQQRISKVPAHLQAHAFKPGVSGNPAGRPPGRSLTARLRQALDEPHDDHGSVLDALARVLLDMALGGDIAAFKLLLDRVEGRVAYASGPEGDLQPIRGPHTLDDDPRWSEDYVVDLSPIDPPAVDGATGEPVGP